MEFSVYFSCGNTLHEKCQICLMHRGKNLFPSHVHRNSSFLVTHPESPQRFTFLCCFLAPFTPTAEPENDHQQALYSWSPALGCWQQVRVEGLLLFGSSEMSDCWSSFQLHTVCVISDTIPEPCVISGDWFLSSSPTISISTPQVSKLCFAQQPSERTPGTTPAGGCKSRAPTMVSTTLEDA